MRLTYLLTVGLGFVLAAAVSASEVESVVDATPVASEDVCYESAAGGYFASAELTVLKPHLGAANIIIVALPEHDWGSGMRYTVGHRDCDGFGWRGRFWHFDERNDLGGGEGIGLNAKTFDVEATQLANLCGFELDFSLGFRWGRVENHFNSAGFLETFEGAGTTAAIQGRRNLCGQLSLVGGSRVSLLYGTHNIQVLGFPVQITEEVLPIWEMQAGVERATTLSNGAQAYVRIVAESQLWETPPALLGLGDQNIGLFGLAVSAGIAW